MSDNTVHSNPSFYKITVVTDETNVNVTQGITKIVQVNTPGPQGPSVETDPIFTAVSGTFTLTSSFNSFTASYNTGSFSGSFIGNLLGTSSWATQALTASYVNPLVQNVIITGSVYLPDNAHSIYFSGSSNASRLLWNDTDGTLDLGLKGGNVTLQVGQEQVARVVNKTGANLLESQYKVVRIRRSDEGGTQGQRLAVVLAQGNNDNNSVDTLGIVTENIDVNQEGFITTSGLVRNIDTRGVLQGETWTDGDALYLSPTTAGALTNVKPQAPNHTVVMGYVVYAHQNQGKIFVKVDNGYEIDELHNVRITTASLSTGQLLTYSSSVWINTNQLTGSYGITGSLSFQNGGVTGSLHGTASWAQYVVNGGNIDTSALVTTSSFNSFTSSYNTGSFTGSFRGNLTGTASWATQALTASFIPIGTYQVTASWAQSASQALTASFLPVNTYQITASWAESASNALTASYINTLYSSNFSASFGSSTTWTINHNLNTRYVIVQTFNSSHNQILPQEITLTNANTVTATFSQAESGYAVVTVGGALTYNYVTYTSPNDMLQMNNDSSTLHDLIFLETDDTWYPVDQSNTSATRMLAINSGSNYALVEGYVTVGENGNASGVPLIAGTLNTGAPVYIKEGATNAPFLDTTVPTTGIVRLLGHLISVSGSYYWLMKFRPDHTWVEI